MQTTPIKKVLDNNHITQSKLGYSVSFYRRPSQLILLRFCQLQWQPANNNLNLGRLAGCYSLYSSQMIALGQVFTTFPLLDVYSSSSVARITVPAIRSKSCCPTRVTRRPPVGSFSNTFISSNCSKTDRMIPALALRKCSVRVPRR